MKKNRVAINGFGRIGRTLLRVLLERENCEVVAINDLFDSATMAHLFKYDSVHGKWAGNVSSTPDRLLFGDNSIHYFQERDPLNLPWKDLEIDILIECSGAIKTRHQIEKHITAGARRVLLSAPPEEDSIPIIVPGVNTDLFDPKELIVSCASCTTNSAAHMIQLVNELCVIESCYVTTVHSYTGDQRLHDAPHKDWRRGRAAAQSIVPTSTGAAKALTRVFPFLADKMGGCGIRVPVPDGSLTDITCVVEKPISIEKLNEAFRNASQDRWLNILEYTNDPVVSVDVIDNPHSCLFDSQLTSVIGQMVKVVGWYDNEFGYSNRLADMITWW